MSENHTAILSQHEVRIQKVEDEVGAHRASLAVFTSVMEGIGEDIKGLKYALEKHMDLEEKRLIKALTVLMLVLGAGLVSTIVYIFTNQS